MTPLPEGRRGQALAVALLLVALGVLWLVAAAPLLGWYDARAARLLAERALAARMAEVAAALPALERAADAPARPAQTAAVLPGGSDALAAAALQERLDALAHGNGVTVVSSEPLPARPAGRVRRIALRLVLSAPYASLVHLLEAMAGAAPTMLVDDLGLRTSLGTDPDRPAPLEVTMTVTAFRAEAGPPS